MELILKKYLWCVYLFVIAIIAYFFASLAHIYLSLKILPDISPKNNSIKVISSLPNRNTLPFESYRVILERNMFDSKDLAIANIPDTQPAQDYNPNAPAVRTTLNLHLLSTFVVGDGTDQRSTAIIQGSGPAEAYSVGDNDKSFSPGAKITQIFVDKVEFTNNGRKEFLEMDSFSNGGMASNPSMNMPTTPSIKPPSTGSKVIDKQEIVQALANKASLISQINVAPNMVNGKSSGAKIKNIAPGSLFSKLGIQKDDVVERVNGTELDLTSFADVLKQMESASHISIDLIRNGQKQSFDYDVR